MHISRVRRTGRYSTEVEYYNHEGVLEHVFYRTGSVAQARAMAEREIERREAILAKWTNPSSAFASIRGTG